MDIPWDNMDGLLGGNWRRLLAPGTPLFEKWSAITEQCDAIRNAVLLRP